MELLGNKETTTKKDGLQICMLRRMWKITRKKQEWVCKRKLIGSFNLREKSWNFVWEGLGQGTYIHRKIFVQGNKQRGIGIKTLDKVMRKDMLDWTRIEYGFKQGQCKSRVHKGDPKIDWIRLRWLILMFTMEIWHI